jgi:ferredoxin-type protein NapH
VRFFKNLYKRFGFIILLFFLMSGFFNPSIAVFALICMMGPILLSLFKGRFWCGHLCPRGNFFDNVTSVFSNKKRVPWILRNIFVRALVCMGLLYYFINSLIKHWGNLQSVGMIFYKMIALTTIIGILLSVIFSERAWCHFCPMGSISAFVSLFRRGIYPLRVLPICIDCKLCAKVCPLSIKPYKYKGKDLIHPDCISCGNCMGICPKKAVMRRGN